MMSRIGEGRLDIFGSLRDALYSIRILFTHTATACQTRLRCVGCCVAAILQGIDESKDGRGINPLTMRIADKA
jgi:hypothetical protein